MSGIHASGYLNAHSKKPISLPFPWLSEPRAEQVTPEERAALKESLRSRSAFAN